MAQLMLVNPKRRKRARKAATRRNPKRRRRTMTALQRQYFGGGRKAKAAPKRRRRRARAASAVAAPRRHKRRSTHRRRSFARNTSGSVSIGSIMSGGVLKSVVMPAALGAAGAIALDIAYAYLPLPANLKAGSFAVPVKAAAVLGIGALASRFLPKQRTLINGAVLASLTIAAYNFGRAQIATMLPGVQLNEYVSGMGYTGAAQFLPDYSSGVSEYVSGANPGASQNAWDYSSSGDEVF